MGGRTLSQRIWEGVEATCWCQALAVLIWAFPRMRNPGLLFKLSRSSFDHPVSMNHREDFSDALDRVIRPWDACQGQRSPATSRGLGINPLRRNIYLLCYYR